MLPNYHKGNTPVVTGIGAISPLGAGVGHLWRGIRSGTSAVREIQSFSTEGFSTRVGCEVTDSFRFAECDVGRTSSLALSAIDEATNDACCTAAEIEHLCVGTTMGNLLGLDDLSNVERLSLGMGMDLSSRLSLRTPGETILTACSAGNLAIARASDLIRSGAVSCVLAGGAESLSFLSFVGFSRMHAMAKTNCKPFDAARDGMLLGEGAAFLLLESLGRAERRGADILAVVKGYGLTCDAHHIAAPEGRGAARAIAQALDSAGIRPESVDYICAHGTGTKQNDVAEARAYRSVMADASPPISSIKALIGHALGASSAIEAVACVLSIQHQEIIPQWGHTITDPECDVQVARPELEHRATSVRVVLNNAFAFGGNNTCIVLERGT